MQSVPEHFYRQSAVIPYCIRAGQVSVMLIGSRRGKRWIVPKGIVEPGMTAAESAAKEALEEAGIRGRVWHECVGAYQYRKWGGVCHVEVFLMEIDEQLPEWDEMHRDRRWLSLKEAARLVGEAKLSDLIERLPRLIEHSREDRAAS